MREVFMERSIAVRATDSSLGVRGRAGFMLAACAACTFHAPTYAGDSWTGNDKREHFAYSAMTAVVVQAVVPNPWAAAALASAPGLLRELTGSTGFSHKDMAWNLAGVALGVAGGRFVAARSQGRTQVTYTWEY